MCSSDLVCVCRAVTEKQIETAVHAGARHLRDLRTGLGIIEDCGRCARCASWRQLQRGQQPTDVRMTATNSARVTEMVRDDEVSLGFVEGPDAPKGLRRRLVGTDELVVVVGPRHPWAQRPRRRVSAATLAATPLVVREAGSGTRTVLERALAGNEDLDRYSSYVGSGAVRFYLPMDVLLQKENIAQLVVVAKNEAARNRLQKQLEQILSKDFSTLTTRVSTLELGPPVGWPVRYRVSGPDNTRVRELATQLAGAGPGP